MLVPCSFDDCSFVVQSEVRKSELIPPALFFFLKIALVIQGLLYFHKTLKFFCFSFVKNVIGNLIEIPLNLKVAWSIIVILTILILPIQEHGISSHLFVSSYEMVGWHH